MAKKRTMSEEEILLYRVIDVMSNILKAVDLQNKAIMKVYKSNKVILENLKTIKE